MWLAVLAILPSVAICLAIWFFLRPLHVVLGWSQLEQELEFNPELVRELAYDRGQSDEYETLLAMEFVPLGLYNENYGFMSGHDPELIFRHRKYPIFTSLVNGIDGQRFVQMKTAGEHNRFLVTSSSENAMSENDVDYRAFKIEAGLTEDVFISHVTELDKWQDEGFIPIANSDLMAYQKQSGELFQHAKVQKLMRSACLYCSLGSLIATIVLPAIFGTAMAVIASPNFIPLTATLIVQFASLWSLGYSLLFYRLTVRFVKKPRNSLKNSVSLLAFESVDIKKTTAGATTSFVLPFRNTKRLRFTAGYTAFGFSVGVFMCCCGIYIAAITALQIPVKLWIIDLPMVLFPIFGLYWLIPKTGLAVRVVMNKSQHELSVDGTYIYSVEKMFLRHHNRKCYREHVDKIYVESIKECEELIRWMDGEWDEHWGVLFVKDEFGVTILQAAQAYRVDFLVNLAEALAVEIGLGEDAVVIGDSILDPDFGETNEPSETEQQTPAMST